MKDLAPIALFTYNRIDETKMTVEALKNNFLASKSDLIIFSDGPKNTKSKNEILELRKYLKTISGFKSIQIKESSSNKGLAKSIIQGVSSVLDKYGKIIVLEDDLVSAPNFLNFMNQALHFYDSHKVVQSVNAYSLDIENEKEVYFHERTFPWGWGTWRDRWSTDIFDFQRIEKSIDTNSELLSNFDKKCGADMSRMLKEAISGTINSWYIRWAFNHFVNNRYAVFPKQAFVTNIGFDTKGTHCKGINTYVSKLDKGENIEFMFSDFYKLGKTSNQEFLKYFKRIYKLIFRLKLLTSIDGISLINKEIKNRIFNR